MSTIVSALSRKGESECLRSLLCTLEANSSLFQPEQLRSRLSALDDLDAGFRTFVAEDSRNLPTRANALRTQLEAANADLYDSVRSAIVRTGQPHALLRWLHDPANRVESTPALGLGFDCRDELLSGVLQLHEPCEPDPQRSPEMLPYQPTPVRGSPG